MDNKTKFNKLVNLLRAQQDIQFSEACLSDIMAGDIQVKHFRKPFSRERQLEVLSKRQKGLEKRKKEKLALGLPEVIKNLEKYTGDELYITKVANQEGNYSVFTNNDFKTLIGIIKFSKMNLDQLKDLEEKNLEMGYDKIDRWYAPDLDDLPREDN